MDTGGSSDVFLFEQFHFDPRSGRLSRCAADGTVLPVNVGSRALAVLGILVERAGDLVPRGEIMSAVWPGTTVEEANLTVQISALRRALDAGRSGGSCILNVTGRGYRFLPEVHRIANRAEPPSVVSAPTGLRPSDKPVQQSSDGPPLIDPPPTLPLPAKAIPEPEPPGSRTPLALVRRGSVGVILVAILALGGWWMLRDKVAPPLTSATTPVTPRPAAYSPEDRRLSIIVLPFENSSGDPRQDDLAAGITRDITDRFARAGGPVIPAATAASYRGKAVDLQTLGRDHNVHFALTGSARRQDGRMIVSATFYEEDSGRALWSQRFDRPDNSDEWNGIIEQIHTHCAQASVDAEVARAMREHPESLDKRDLMLAYEASSMASSSKEHVLAWIALIDRALAIDPDYVRALTEKALVHTQLVDWGYSSDPSADLSIAMKAVDRALQLAPDDVWALRRKASVLQDQGDLEGAAALIRKVLEMEPLDGWRYRQLGIIQMAQGRFKEALENFATAKRLGGSPPMPLFSQSLALGLLANDRFPDAIAEARLAMGLSQSDLGRSGEGAWLALIAAESENGQDVEARADLQKFLATPRTYRSMAEIQKYPLLAANRRLLDGLQRAGMPAE